MKCFHCHMTMPDGATKCPYCHNKPYIENYKDRKTFAKWVFIISGGLAVIGGVLLIIRQTDNTIAYTFIGMAGLTIVSTITGLICSWVEKRLESDNTSWWESTLMFIGILLLAGLILGIIFMIFYWH